MPFLRFYTLDFNKSVEILGNATSVDKPFQIYIAIQDDLTTAIENYIIKRYMSLTQPRTNLEIYDSLI